jgi:hypothetical protein
MKWTMAQQRLYRRQVAELALATGQYDDEARRAVLMQVTGHSSTAEISDAQMKRVIDFQERLLRKCDPEHHRSRRARFRPAMEAKQPVGLGTAITSEIQRLDAEEPASDRPKRQPGQRWTQDYYIAFLESELGWAGTPERLKGFIRRETRGWTEAVADLSPRQKGQLISGLRRLFSDQRRGTARTDRPNPGQKAASWTPHIISAH